MKNKKIALIVIFTIIVLFAININNNIYAKVDAGGGGGGASMGAHTCTYDYSKWSYNNYGHWHECTSSTCPYSVASGAMNPTYENHSIDYSTGSCKCGYTDPLWSYPTKPTTTTFHRSDRRCVCDYCGATFTNPSTTNCPGCGLTFSNSESSGTSGSGSPNSTHQHTWSNEWSSDFDYHWKECTDPSCYISKKDCLDYGIHEYGETYQNDIGLYFKDCKICGRQASSTIAIYEREQEEKNRTNPSSGGTSNGNSGGGSSNNGGTNSNSSGSTGSGTGSNSSGSSGSSSNNNGTTSGTSTSNGGTNSSGSAISDTGTSLNTETSTSTSSGTGTSSNTGASTSISTSSNTRTQSSGGTYSRKVNADDYNTSPSIDTSGKAMNLTKKILGVINVIGTIVLVSTVALLGIKYISGSLEERAEYKRSMLPILIGAFLLFSTSTIINIVYSIMNS